MPSITPAAARRVVLVVLDGLRPDAIDVFDLPNWRRLAALGAETRVGSSVRPSVTAAAMTSLVTGLSPQTHGIADERFRLPTVALSAMPITRALAGAGLPTSLHVRRIPWLYRPLLRRAARLAGAERLVTRGDSADEIFFAARPALREQGRGLFIFHFPDADAAGHAHGWMSDAYGRAARDLDRVLGELAHGTGVDDGGDTLLIACADHGGGGTIQTHHHSDHPADRTIPILLCGAGVVPGALQSDASWLDLPATAVAALGVVPPASWEGRVLRDALRSPHRPEPAAVAA